MSDAEARRVYEEARLGQNVTLGSRPAVLVVDFSCGFTDPECPLGSDLTAEVEATKRLRLRRPAETPNVQSMCSRFSMPGPPFGTFSNDSPLTPFCSGHLKGQWSVETTERTSLCRAFQRCSWCSFGRGGGV